MKKSILLLLAASFLIMTACNNEKKSNEGDKKEPFSSSSETKQGDKKEIPRPSSENKQERNKKVIVASMESFMKGDLDGTFKDVATGFVDYTDGSIPPIGNIDSLKGFIKMLMTSIEGYKGENLMYYADGDHVIVYGDWGGTFKTDMMGIKATGKVVKFKDVDIFKLNDEGKITEHHSVQNIGAVLMTSGMTK
jgi:predicted ester cyclase